MAYITKVDLAKQVKLKSGDTAKLDGNLTLGGELYLTRFLDNMDSDNIYVPRWNPETGRLTPTLANNIGNGNDGNSLGLKYRGTWGSPQMLPYFKGDMVSHDGLLYVLKIAVLYADVEPTEDMDGESEDEPWQVIAVAGYKGEPGENGQDGRDYEYVFLTGTLNTLPSKPTLANGDYTEDEFQEDDFVPYLPDQWTDDEPEVTPEKPNVWYMRRIKANRGDGYKWQEFSEPKIWGLQGGKGDKGDNGVSSFTSIVFYRSSLPPATPTGGSYTSPIPTTSGWSDGIPDGDLPIWLSNRIFTVDGTAPQQSTWSVPKQLGDTPDIDFQYSSVVTNPGTPKSDPSNWSETPSSSTIWFAMSKKKDGIWGDWVVFKVKGENGEDGATGDTYVRRYAVNGSTTIPPTLNNTSAAPSGWATSFPSTVPIGQYLWMTEARITSSGTLSSGSTWATPLRINPVEVDPVDGKSGPSMAYRGDWDSSKTYQGNDYVVDVVALNSVGYIARTDAGTIAAGISPSSTQGAEYWNKFTEDVDSVFTDFLFAYSGYIKQLEVGSIRTSDENTSERTTIGYQPTSTTDPTRGYNIFPRHGIRQYHPSGRIAAYMGTVNNYSYTATVGGSQITKTVNGWAIITFTDAAGSPVFYVLDSNTQNGIQYAQEISFSPINVFYIFGTELSSTATESDMYNWIAKTPTSTSTEIREDCYFNEITHWEQNGFDYNNLYTRYYVEYRPNRTVNVMSMGNETKYTLTTNSEDLVNDTWFVSVSVTGGSYDHPNSSPRVISTPFPGVLEYEFRYIDEGVVVRSVLIKVNINASNIGSATSFFNYRMEKSSNNTVIRTVGVEPITTVQKPTPSGMRLFYSLEGQYTSPSNG